MSDVILTERQILESCIEDCFEGFKELCEELEYTLKFNVNDELALRTFAVNLAMR